jgi:Oxidoreductase family, NAD-binding Rossmann fold
MSRMVDLASVCTPPGTHAEIAARLLDAGVHTLCEKPMATSLKECDAILAAARRSGAVLSVVAQNRFTTSMARLKRFSTPDWPAGSCTPRSIPTGGAVPVTTTCGGAEPGRARAVAAPSTTPFTTSTPCRGCSGLPEQPAAARGG